MGGGFSAPLIEFMGRPKKFIVMVKGDRTKYIRAVNKKIILSLEKEGWVNKGPKDGNNG